MQGVGGWEESRPFISNRIKELLYLPRVPYGQEEARYLRSGHNKKKTHRKRPITHTHTHQTDIFSIFFGFFLYRVSEEEGSRNCCRNCSMLAAPPPRPDRWVPAPPTCHHGRRMAAEQCHCAVPRNGRPKKKGAP